MKTFYVLVADKAWAKLYKFSRQPEQFTLIYHQRNLSSHASEKQDGQNPAGESTSSKAAADDEDFASSLCKMLKLHCKAGMFDGLIVISSREFLAMIYDHLGSECRDRLVGGIVQVPSLLSEQNMIVNVRKALEKQRTSQSIAS